MLLGLFTVGAALMLMVPCVSAETVTGSVTESGWISTAGVAPFAAPVWISYDSIYTTAIENLYGFHTLVKFSDVPARMQFDVPSTSSAQTTVTGTIGTTTIFTGTIGYTNSYDILGNLVGGYEYVETDNWNNLHGYTGIQSVNLSYDKVALYHWQYDGWSGGYAALGTGGACFGSGVPAAPCAYSGANGYITNKEMTFWNGYTVESPIGIGMHGVIEKNDGTKTYPSQVFVYNATSGAIITSQNGTTSADFTFDIFTTPIILGMTTSKPSHVNSSILFGGYDEIPSKDLFIGAVDAVTGNWVIPITVNYHDTSTGVWVNDTYADGACRGTTGQNATIYYEISAYDYYPASNTKITENDYGPEEYVEPLFRIGSGPPAGDLNSSILRLYFQHPNGNPVMISPGIDVLLLTDGQHMVTGYSGVAEFPVTNNTVYSYRASRSAFKTVTGAVLVNTSISEWVVVMTEDTGPPPTPTSSITTYPTPTLTGAALEAHNKEVDESMMAQLREAGPGIIGLAILAIIFGLLNMMAPKR
jgi:hypothetical protein